MMIYEQREREMISSIEEIEKIRMIEKMEDLRNFKEGILKKCKTI